MDTMMALRAHGRGGPEQLVYDQAPAPSAGPGEVLIAVHAAAITFAELTWDLEWTTSLAAKPQSLGGRLVSRHSAEAATLLRGRPRRRQRRHSRDRRQSSCA
jgi:hypothetical protein